MKKQDFEKFRDRVDRIAAALITSPKNRGDEALKIPAAAVRFVELIDKELAAAGYIADDAAADARLARWPHCYACRTRIRIGCSEAFEERSAGRCPFDYPDIPREFMKDQADGLRRLAARASGAGE